MSSAAPPEVGVPVKLIQSQENKRITVDTATGEIYTGILVEAEETMNLTLRDVKTLFPSGVETEMNSVYVKGAKIRYVRLPHEAEDKVVQLMRECRPPMRGRGGGRGGGRGRFGGGGGGDRRRY